MSFSSDRPVANVESGKIAGIYNQDHSVCIYKGIPYAGSTEGEWRWKAPRQASPWDHIRDCSEWGHCAMQGEPVPFMYWTEEFVIDRRCERSEDGLNLSVWAPNDDMEGKPVLVFIHGGGFSIGGSSCQVYDGERMAESGIVYVNIQYRLGTLGYLVHPALMKESVDGTAGNYGFLDQIAALKWIQRNITAFGGDPGNVTISGESAGAASVDVLIASPMARGLFQKAVSISMPSVVLDFPSLEEASKVGERVFAGMTIEEMRELPAEEFLQRRVQGMCIDGVIVRSSYDEAVRSGTTSKVPLMVGMTLGDGPLLYLMQGSCATSEEYRKFIRDQFGELADRCMELYPADPGNVKETMTKLQKEYLISIMDYLAKLREENGQGATWCFLYTHAMPGEKDYGAFHTSDIPYFFHVLSDVRKEYWKEEDFLLADMMSSYLANFVKTGDPNGEGLTEWKQNRDGCGTMELNSHCKMTELSPEKRALFRELIKQGKIKPEVNMNAADES